MRIGPIHVALLAGATIVGALAAPREAEAGPWGWLAHGHFRVGGFDFSVGYHRRSHHGQHHGQHHYPGSYRPVTYYRVNRPISYRGYRCGSACYRSEGSYYHHNACPVVLHHLRRHGYSPGGHPERHYSYDHHYTQGHRYDNRYRHDRRYRGDWYHHDRRGAARTRPYHHD